MVLGFVADTAGFSPTIMLVTVVAVICIRALHKGQSNEGINLPVKLSLIYCVGNMYVILPYNNFLKYPFKYGEHCSGKIYSIDSCVAQEYFAYTTVASNMVAGDRA